MIDCVIAKATIQDLTGIDVIERACFGAPWSLTSLTELVTDGSKYHCLIAFVPDGDHRQPAGYVGVLFVLDEAEVANIAVRPEHAGQGIGYQLLRAAQDYCRTRGMVTLHLEVRTGNAPAIALYRKCGFEETGLRKGYYSDTGEDALLFAWKVTAS
jgi:ribosomal-protein-alanine N-acetyltransferase